MAGNLNNNHSSLYSLQWAGAVSDKMLMSSLMAVNTTSYCVHSTAAFCRKSEFVLLRSIMTIIYHGLKIWGHS